MKVGVQGQGPQTSSSLYITQMLHYRQQIMTRFVMHKAHVTPRSGYKVINKSYSHSHYLGRDILWHIVIVIIQFSRIVYKISEMLQLILYFGPK